MRVGIIAGAILSLAVGLQAGGAGNTVLVWSTGNSQAKTAAVAAWIQASGKFSSVTGQDSGSTALPLATLLNYSEVFFFTNSGGDPTNTGNVLDSYAATGRRLVVTTFAWAQQGGNTVGGSFVSNFDSPFTINSSSLYSTATMASNNGSAFFTGVNSVTGYYRDSVKLASGATLLASWSDGDPMEAIKGNVVGISLFPDDSYNNISGDYKTLFINSLIANNTGSVSATPVPPTFFLACLGMVGLALYMAMKKRTA